MVTRMSSSALPRSASAAFSRARRRWSRPSPVAAEMVITGAGEGSVWAKSRAEAAVFSETPRSVLLRAMMRCGGSAEGGAAAVRASASSGAVMSARAITMRVAQAGGVDEAKQEIADFEGAFHGVARSAVDVADDSAVIAQQRVEQR